MSESKAASARGQAFGGYACALITAEALLATVLLVWAQLWAQSYVSTGLLPTLRPTVTWNVLLPTAEFGLVWTYAAVLSALTALGTTALCLALPNRATAEEGNVRLPDVAVGLFAAGLQMSVLNVGQSAVSAFVRSWHYSTSKHTVLEKAAIYAQDMLKPIDPGILLAEVVTLGAIVLTCVMVTWGARTRDKSKVWRCLTANGVTIMALATLITVNQQQGASALTVWIGWVGLLALATTAVVLVGRHIPRNTSE
jgi:hypothetical protein